MKTAVLTKHEVTRQLATQLKQAAHDVARAGGSESDLSHHFDRLLDDALNELGITVGRWSHEKGMAKSRTKRIRADALYGGVVVEFEKPGKFKSEREVAASVQQVQDALKALRAESDVTAGVATDGFKLAFVRWQDGKAVAEPAQDVSPLAIAELLGLISKPVEKRLTPQNFEFDFGAGSVAAKKTVKALVTALRQGLAHSTHVETFYGEWRRILGIAYGLPEKDDAPLSDAERAKHERIVNELAELYEIEGVTAFDFGHILFSIHTYYTLLIKLLIADLMSQLVPPAVGRGDPSTGSGQAPAAPAGTAETPFPTVPQRLCRRLAKASQDTLLKELFALEDGKHFTQLRNFLEGDFFRWYVETLTDDLAAAIRYLCGLLSSYRLRVGQPQTRDLFKRVYQNLVPRRIRHDLGEYYTPDWLAELTLNRLGYDGEGRLLDPACGSGTFLVLAIERALKAGAELSDVLTNIVGFDISPLAVLAARANYVLAIRDLLSPGHWSLVTGHAIEIPVYQTDSILIPQLRPQQRQLGQSVPVPTSVGDFEIPSAFADDRELVERVMAVLEEAVRQRWDADRLLKECQRRKIVVPDDETAYGLETLLTKMRELSEQGKNEIWCRVLKNQFAPLFVGTFDFVAGNPPWVNWESLPESYRQRTEQLWFRHGLFLTTKEIRRRGDEVMSVILGKGKKDLAMLMTYVAADSYLEQGGKLGFVITQSVFKTAGAGQGFRRFRIGNKTPLKVVCADDLVELQPFEGASNRTALIVLQKGERTTYPVPYTLWRKRETRAVRVGGASSAARGAGQEPVLSLPKDAPPTRIEQNMTLGQVMQATTQTQLSARPVDAKDPTSSWLTISDNALKAVRKVTGKADYQAHAGVYTGGANAVYWLRIKSVRPDGKVVCENITEGAKTKVPQLRDIVLEPDLLYPLLRGRDVQRWHAEPSAHILMVQDPVKRRGINEDELRHRCPETYRYLKRFENVLRQRAAFIRYFKPDQPFYSMFDVGDYTLAPWKVVWRYIAEDFTCAVVSQVTDKSLGERMVICDSKLMLVPLESEDEAHYVCALLNSCIVRFVVQGYRVQTQISTHVLNHIRIPRFNPKDGTHRQLAQLSQRAHQLAAAGKTKELAAVEAQIDETAAKVWGLTKSELRALQAALKDS